MDSFDHRTPQDTTGRTRLSNSFQPLSNPRGFCSFWRKSLVLMSEVSLSQVSGFSVTFWEFSWFSWILALFREFWHFCTFPIRKPETWKTVKNTVNQWCPRKNMKITENHQKQQKWTFLIFRLGLGRDFYKKCQFWQVGFWQSKSGSFEHSGI